MNVRPNKPVLPTADTRPNEDPPDPLRRQTGEPLDRPQVTPQGQQGCPPSG